MYELLPESMQVFKLQTYIEKRNSCEHLQMFCCVVPSEGNEHIMAVRTESIDELS